MLTRGGLKYVQIPIEHISDGRVILLGRKFGDAAIDLYLRIVIESVANKPIPFVSKESATILIKNRNLSVEMWDFLLDNRLIVEKERIFVSELSQKTIDIVEGKSVRARESAMERWKQEKEE